MPWNKQNVPTAAKNLPQAARGVFIDAANNALKRGEDEASAIKIGLTAVKNAGWRKLGDKWVQTKKKAKDMLCVHCQKSVALPDDTSEEDYHCPVCSSPLIAKALDAADLQLMVKLAQIPQWLRGQMLDSLQKARVDEGEEMTEDDIDEDLYKQLWIHHEKAIDLIVEESVKKGVEGDRTYHILKAEDEKRFTLGPVYSPGKVDAHDETIDADELQKAMWDYVEKGDRTIYLQHTKQRAGTWVELVTWPADISTSLRKSEGEEADVTFPAGTVFMGVRWDEEVWPLVKSGKITGYSLGGTATRVEIPAEVQEDLS